MRTVEEIERADRTLAKDLKAMLADKECYGEMTGYQVTTVDFLADVLDGISDKRLAEICAAEKDGRCVVLPCKTGDTINAFRWDCEKERIYVISDKVTSVTTNKNGYTIKTKSKFYPIKQKNGDTFAPISEYPRALADYYIGSAEDAKKVLEAPNE